MLAMNLEIKNGSSMSQEILLVKRDYHPWKEIQLSTQEALESETYWILHSQLTYNFRRFSVYLGGENLLNTIQDGAIIAPDDPFGSYFDATQIWAPISGFNIYGGIHFEIDQKAEKQRDNLK